MDITGDANANQLFVEAIKLTNDDFYIDGLHKFLEIVKQYPESELADDALFNAGLCHFHLKSFHAAIRIFKRVISDYPDGDIYNTSGNDREHGKTAAKCHYALINCYLGLGELPLASQELGKLTGYSDSYLLV